VIIQETFDLLYSKIMIIIQKLHGNFTYHEIAFMLTWLIVTALNVVANNKTSNSKMYNK